MSSVPSAPAVTPAAPLGKKWYTSKTVWLNILTLALGLATIVSKILPAPIGFAVTAILIPALNLVLRIWFTNQPIG
jgi:hypothetical protein